MNVPVYEHGGGKYLLCSITCDIKYTVTPECTTGHYGENCSHSCYCGDGLPCEQSSGYCQSRVCKAGWLGQCCNESKYFK